MATRRSPRRENLTKSRAPTKGNKAENGNSKSSEESGNESLAVKQDSSEDAKNEVKPTVEDGKDPQPGPSSLMKKRGKKGGGKLKDEKGEGGDSSFASAMLLDVLAQVASDRLETEPQRAVLADKKLSKRVLSTLDILTLDHILQLNDKLLISLFSELTANEMTRNYSFTCMLMPDKCKTAFSSYGNELRSKSLMLAHLKQHVKKLTTEQEEKDDFKFAAEPLHARKKRLAAEKSLLRKVWSKSMKKTVLIKRSGSESFTSLRSAPLTGIISTSGGPGGKKTKHSSAATATNNADDNTFTPPPNKKQKAAPVSLANRKKGGKGKGKAKGGDVPEVEETASSDVDVEGGNTPMKVTGDDGPNSSKQQVEKTIEENEQFIIDLLRRTQPYQDHSYTTVFGNRNVWPPPDGQDADAAGEEEGDRPSARTAGLMSLNYKGGREGNNDSNNTSSSSMNSSSSNTPSSTPVTELGHDDIPNRHVIMKIGSGETGASGTSLHSTVPQQHVPIIRLSQPGATPQDNMPIVSAEEVVVQEAETTAPSSPPAASASARDRRYRPNTKKSVYPPMPKSDLARQGRVQVLEEMLLCEEDDKNTNMQLTVPMPVRQTVVVGKKRKLPQLLRADGTTDWERRMALKCIRELRLRKREDGSLNCKICENKSFTATATLMYHYRSHAGIKPFVCLICNTTFTRQHSLNYHMLIHNNQSRFTCKDCGRKFRHPSHFKEHMRRHTGETPFHCTDCPLRFKTRNTYKRHLRTRHNKLLTADGIRFMPYDPAGIRLRMKTEQLEEGSEEEDEEEEEEEDEEEEEEYEEADEASKHLVVQEAGAVAVPVDLGGTTIPATDAVATQAASSTNPAPMGQIIGAIPPENTASNKLLQFCSQVVSQEAG